jgi:hypothetical protein
MTFDDLLNGKATAREKILYDAETTEAERKDFRNALNALKDCIGIDNSNTIIRKMYFGFRLFFSWWYK